MIGQQIDFLLIGRLATCLLAMARQLFQPRRAWCTLSLLRGADAGA
jgi:hypothetical protein